MEEKDTCTTCYKIVCRQCQWEPDESQLRAIQKGELTACPECGWKPGDNDESRTQKKKLDKLSR